MAAPQGLIQFPGIQQILGGTLTRSHGLAPWPCMIQIAPQDSLPTIVGTLAIIFGRVKLTFPDSQIDLSTVQRDRGGKIVSLRIMTRHWKWKYGVVDGLYNERTNSGKLIEKLERSPKQLADRLVAEMGEKNVDLRILDSLARPRKDWISANPANELATLCDSLGCRFLVNLKNQLVVVRLGEGRPLPDGDVMQEGLGFNPADRPDIIRVIGGPDVFQSLFILEAVGEENDDAGTLKPIDELSYRPKDGWGKESPQGFWGVAPGESKDAKEKCRQLALKTVYRLYRIQSQLAKNIQSLETNTKPGTLSEGFGNFKYDDWGFPQDFSVTIEDRKQIVLLPTQIVKAPALTDDDPQRFKPAQVIGSYYPETWSAKNTDPAALYDGQFSIDPTPKRQLVEFAKPVYMYKSVLDDPSKPNGTRHMEFAPADLKLYTSYHVKDKNTLQLVRSSKDRKIGKASSKSKPLVLPVVRDDIFRSKRATYKNLRQFKKNPLTGQEELITVATSFAKTVNNNDDFDQGCDHYLDAEAKQFQDVATAQRLYAGIRDDIDLDGAIQQITYTVGRAGATTVASINSEHDYDIPTYEKRRQEELTRFIPR